MGDGYIGNSVDTARIQRISKLREENAKAFKQRKEDGEAKAGRSRLLGFAKSRSEVVEATFKRDTVGLQTKEQFTEKKNNIEKQIEAEQELRRRAAEEAELRDRARKRNKKKVATTRLSFADEEEGEEEEEGPGTWLLAPTKKHKALKFGSVGKNPDVVTGFLPDRDRERLERVLREKLKEEWTAQQQLIKDELLEVTYSYWDGTGHRKTLKVTKGSTIGEFLSKVREQLAPDYREMRTQSTDQLLYIKEDLIIPHEFSFHWMIENKARGKSGPLFHFDVHEDIRMINDASKEKEEAHAGKVVDRHWYDKNKHIFPASRWEVYDPKVDYGGYTIHDAR